MDSHSDKRSELLDRIVEVLLNRGTAELSLRPLGEQVGTSARLLIYHFTTKDDLLVAARSEVRRRVARLLREEVESSAPQSFRELLQIFWKWATQDSNQKYFRFLFEIDGQSMFAPQRASVEDVPEGASIWLAMIERAAERVRPNEPLSPQRKTLLLAAITGLLQDFLTTGDAIRTGQALDSLLDLLEPEKPRRQRKPQSRAA
jgi:AcrR family transcriptional regulator